MQELRLFQLTDIRTKKPVTGLFFSNKHNAKCSREKMNEAEKQLRFIVSPGPDHEKFRG
jgi:hypothetical protein